MINVVNERRKERESMSVAVEISSIEDFLRNNQDHKIRSCAIVRMDCSV